jgi:methionine-rich copper-binding protein CopC
MQLRSGRAGLTTAAVLVGVAVLAVLLLARPAGAALSAATPADGSRLDQPPTAVSLTFTAAVTEVHVAVSDAENTGSPTADGPTVSQPIRIIRPGQHVVTYHVGTRDGEVAGTLAFSVGAGAAAPVAPSTHHGGEVDRVTAALIVGNVVVVLVLVVLFLRRGRGRDVQS